MSYKVEKKEGKAVVEIAVSWQSIEPDFKKAVVEASKNVSMKGFRKGHVPADLAEKQVDKAIVFSHVAEKMLNAEYEKAVKEEKFRIVGSPEVNIKKFAEGNDVEATLTMTLMPEIELPKKWQKLVEKVNKDFAEKKAEVTKEEIDEEVKKIAQSRVSHQKVEREAKKDDHVKIDFTVKLDGVVIENGTSLDHSLILGKGVFIPGFEEEVMGMKVGETKNFALTFPEKYHAKHLAGKKADFEVTLKLVEERVLPEINDEFAKSLNKKFETLADFKKNLEEGILKEKERTNEEEKNKNYIDVILEEVKVTLPEVLVKDELKRMIAEFSQQISMSGMNFDDYLKMVKKTKEDLEKEWFGDAEKRVKSALLLEELAKVLEIEVDSKEIEEEMNKVLSYYKGVKDLQKNINMEYFYESTKGILSNQKVLKALGEMK